MVIDELERLTLEEALMKRINNIPEQQQQQQTTQEEKEKEPAQTTNIDIIDLFEEELQRRQTQ
jgi:hypothetical protein